MFLSPFIFVFPFHSVLFFCHHQICFHFLFFIFGSLLFACISTTILTRTKKKKENTHTRTHTQNQQEQEECFITIYIFLWIPHFDVGLTLFLCLHNPSLNPPTYLPRREQNEQGTSTKEEMGEQNVKM